MDEDRIDVSAGLDISLELFALHRLSGTLQAELHRVPGLPKKSTARLELVNGAVVSCSVIDKQGQQAPIAKEVLIRLNDERGPFEWSFHPVKPTSPNHVTNHPPTQTRSPQPQRTPTGQAGGSFPVVSDTNMLIPHAVAVMNWHWFHNWTPQQRQALFMVWRLIDGRHTVWEIKEALQASHAPTLVDEILNALLTLKVIILKK
ncbi:hypothetical protein [Ktedonospora formicarum]|uniref:Uncharacterized protein n=1 Tax=Ktedonospora formicarum TaxID=2778364 RepID=A0A8J3I749_9CHLR|nr:hypothetical protein [Ktedonospora formicarum]GHO47043.1 hypothetical protein KSX_52060 [Ktedonospora formicarum]